MIFDGCEPGMGLVLRALRFAAEKHIDQRRKGSRKAPYINHPIQVTELLWDAGVRDAETLAAALLHDTIEDTDTTPEELQAKFGERVLALVLECTDDKSLPKAERKRLQVEHAPHKSPGAKQIKLGDKINNVIEISADPPAGWSIERRKEYLEWTAQVVLGLRGQNPALEARYDQALRAGLQVLQTATQNIGSSSHSEEDPD